MIWPKKSIDSHFFSQTFSESGEFLKSNAILFEIFWYINLYNFQYSKLFDMIFFKKVQISLF